MKTRARNRKKRKAASIDPGVGRFLISAGSLVLQKYASGIFLSAGTVPPGYTRRREIKDDLHLRAMLANLGHHPMGAPGVGANFVGFTKGLFVSMNKE